MVHARQFILVLRLASLGQCELGPEGAGGSQPLCAARVDRMELDFIGDAPGEATRYYCDLLLASEPAQAVRVRLEAFASSAGSQAVRDRGLIHLILALPEQQLM